MNDPVHVIHEDGWKIEIHYDEEGKDFEDLIPDDIHVQTWHRRRIIGERIDRPNSVEEYNDLIASIKAEHPGALIMPLFAYEHGGITFSLQEYSDLFDSGQVGIVWASGEEIEDKDAALAAFVEEMSACFEGAVYGWTVVDPEGEIKDSCWQYVGRSPEKEDSPLMLDARKMLEYWQAQARSGEELVANHFAL